MGPGHDLLLPAPTCGSGLSWQRLAHFTLSPTSVSSLPSPSLLLLSLSHLQQLCHNALNTRSVNEFCCCKFFVTKDCQARALGPGPHPGPRPFGSPGWGAEPRSECSDTALAGRRGGGTQRPRPGPGRGGEKLSRGQRLGLLPESAQAGGAGEPGLCGVPLTPSQLPLTTRNKHSYALQKSGPDPPCPQQQGNTALREKEKEVGTGTGRQPCVLPACKSAGLWTGSSRVLVPC